MCVGRVCPFFGCCNRIVDACQIKKLVSVKFEFRKVLSNFLNIFR